jgi:hypothetical protein
MFWWIVLAVVVVGFALAWWSSGRAKGRAGSDVQKDAAQGDALRKFGTAGGGGGSNINPGGGGANIGGGF